MRFDGYGARPLVDSHFTLSAAMRVSRRRSELLQGVLYALMVGASLRVMALLWQTEFTVPYQLLALLAMLLSFILLKPVNIEASWSLAGADSQGWTLLRRWGALCGLVLLINYLLGHAGYFSRAVLVLWFVLTPAILLVAHARLRALGPRWRSALMPPPKTTLVVCANSTARQLCQRLTAANGYRLLGYMDDRDASRPGSSIDQVKRLGRVGEVADYVRKHQVDVVFVVLPGERGGRLNSLLEALGDTTASIYFVPDFELMRNRQAKVRHVDGILALEIAETPFYGVEGMLKRLFDILFASVILVALALPMLLIALIIKLDSPGPVLFKQVRYGLNGKPFNIYKFRSMVQADRSGEIAQVTHDDPRVTRAGRILRRSSLDELPQFFNVLRGEMSVVGPRPHSVAHNDYYRRQVKNYMTRHKVRPGLTGWAQIHGLRGETAQTERMGERVKYDLEYIRNWSMMLDTGIIAKTIEIIFRDENAY